MSSATQGVVSHRRPLAKIRAARLCPVACDSRCGVARVVGGAGDFDLTTKMSAVTTLVVTNTERKYEFRENNSSDVIVLFYINLM